MSQVSTSPGKAHITQTPGICGGKPCIAGSRIRVQDVYVWHELQGKRPDEIVSNFPELKLADVYAALSYFWEHRDEILEDLKAQDGIVIQAKAQFPSKVTAKLLAKGNGDAVSS